MYNSNEIAARIRMAISEQKKQQETLLKKCGLNKNTLSDYKKSFPKADNLAKIADELNVSVDYLLGRPTYNLPRAEQVLLEQFALLDKQGRTELLKYLEYQIELTRQRSETADKPKGQNSRSQK